MFCQKCGKQLDDGVAFCDSCGNRQEIQSEPQISQIKTSLMTNGNGKTKNNALSLIGGITLLLFVILKIPETIRIVKYLVEGLMENSLENFIIFEIFVIVLQLAGYVFLSVLLLQRKNNKLFRIALLSILIEPLYILLYYRDIALLIDVLWVLLLVFSVFFKDKTKLSKLTLIYVLLPVILFVFSIASGQVVEKNPYYYVDDYTIHYSVFFSYLFLYIGLMFTGLHIIDTDKEITENELAKHKKLYSIGTNGLICFFASLVVAILIIAISNLIWNEIPFFDTFFSNGVLWGLPIVAFLFGMVTMPLFFINIKYINKIQMENAEQGILTDGYMDMTKHILLLLFTFGIWQYIWVHRTTAYLNRTPNAEQYNPTTKLFLCMFVPFYSIYWIYKHSQRIDTLLKVKNPAHSDIATTFLIISIFIPVVTYIMMQDKINTIAKNKDIPIYQTSPVNAPPPKTEENTFTHLEEVKQLKELLDTGVITQEEFDAKKKQLLEL